MRKLLLVSAIVFLCQPAYAVDKLNEPYVSKGEWELEYSGHRSVDDDGTVNNTQAHELELEYGINDWWKTEIGGLFEKDADDKIDFGAVEWENTFQFTDKGKYWLDAGASLAYEWTPEGGVADAIEGGLILARDMRQSFHLFNAVLEKEVGNGPRDSMEGTLLWSSRYKYSPSFQPGFEIQSEFGELSQIDGDSQEHHIGPVAYGTFPIGDEELEYRVGYLFGVSDAASDGEIVWQLEYEIDF